jgi:murein DD-endopeptidase MepM/ murein hydrolase activator NlpD
VTAALAAALLLTAPAVGLDPPLARPGDAVLIAVAAEAAPQGALLGRPLRFFEAGPGRWLALAPVPIEARPGLAPLALDGEDEAALEVVPPGFRSTTLTVAPRFLEPPPSARARVEADRAALAAAYAQHFEPPLFDGPFVLPRQAEVTGAFGDRRVYNGKTSGVHNGLDLTGQPGDPIEAAATGRVVLTRDCYFSGWTTLVWHGAGVYSAYLHQSKIEVKRGQQVVRGQRIGRVGSTGRSTGPHLHWGVKVDGLWVNPESVLRLNLGKEAMAAIPTSTSTSTPTETSTPTSTSTETPPRAPPSGAAPPVAP